MVVVILHRSDMIKLLTSIEQRSIDYDRNNGNIPSTKSDLEVVRQTVKAWIAKNLAEQS